MTRAATEAGFGSGRPAAHIDVLMYHSISGGAGPTCIHPVIFAEQMAALAEAGCQVMSLSQLATLRANASALPARTVIITFDDAYANFAENAAPLLIERGWTATVFAPTGWVGRQSGWEGASGEALMDWRQIRDLTKAGIEFGSHSVWHRDLTTLDGDELSRELTFSQSRLEQELGAPARTFAAPYGALNGKVRAEIARYYDVAVTTRLARTRRTGDLHDVPRVEMHYFRDIRRWRRFLAGRADDYFVLRQIARAVRGYLP
jgi:peptidoglycan/xylan/chitin deacetylase (PgdA/CDA1 family)